MSSPLLCHDHPTTSLLKEGPGLYQLTPDTAPGLAFLDPQQEVFLGLDNVEINTPSFPSQDTEVSTWSEPSLRWHSAPHTCSHPLAQWSTYLCHQRELHLPGPPSHLGADRFSVSPVVWVDSPAQLPTAHSALQSSTAFKQEPHRPPVNHLAPPPHPQHDGLRTAHTFST